VRLSPITARVLLIGLACVLVAAPAAYAQDRIAAAAESLRSDPVYVDPDAERAISDSQARRLREAIVREDAGPLYTAILPAAAAGEAGGDPDAALLELARGVEEPGTYALIVGDSFRAAATEGVLPGGMAGELAARSLEAERGGGTAAVLGDFVRRVGQARAGEIEGSESGEGGGFPGVLLLVLLAVPLALFGLSRRRRRKQEEAEFAQVREVARDDVVALGDDIRSLDIDMEMEDVDPEAKQHYGIAVERYTQASEALDRARRPEDVQHVTELLEEGRWAMEAARAEMEGRQAPERRPPCFFDPRHGPSVTDVEWAPPGGQPRPVPACAADAVRIQEGQDPDARRVSVNGELVPYWQAGPAFAPWAGGFFGAGLLPGLFIGSVLGGAFGGFAVPGEAHAEDQGDFGDFGDFGGGGFGGGDFGGGDFGGGDF
jgi:FlaG/FlaF family flagellin (archaellin)